MALLSLLLSSCYIRKPTGPIPVTEIPAPQPAPNHPLVIVLPGRSDTLEDLQAIGIAAAIQSGWPKANVLLAGATIGYYIYGGLAQRLHDEIILPARARGYREIWLAGASMGGMGLLLYEHRYPGDVTGLVMFAPYMGDKNLVEKIAADGGVQNWNPGSPPVKATEKNYQTEIWQVVKGWAMHPDSVQNVWLATGSRDRLMPASRLIVPVLPAGHFIELPGGHNWKVWDAAAKRIFAEIDMNEKNSRVNKKSGC